MECIVAFDTNKNEKLENTEEFYNTLQENILLLDYWMQELATIENGIPDNW